MEINHRWKALTCLGLALSSGFSCREEAAVGPAKPMASVTPPASAASSSTTSLAAAIVGPVVSGDVAVDGLRVTSGLIGPAGFWGFSDLAVDRKRVRLEVVGGKAGHQLEALLPHGALAVLNGGYFEADFRPSAWLVSKGVALAPKITTGRGGVLAFASAHDVFVGPLSGLGFVPELAVQSFPLIVEPGGKPGILSDDGRRAARNVACLVAGELHFVLVTAPRGDGPTLFETMTLLRDAPPRGFGCESALNLDGGPSVGVVFAPSVAARPRLPIAPIAYGIALLPR